jgi:Lon protease-like protein
MARLPLFPLNSVLFPGAALPLHIFEERYKLMIGRCLEERAPFGVVLIRSGDAAGEGAEPHSTGTTARISHVQRLPDGQMNLLAVGRRRFRILALDRSEPYLAGDVEELSSADVDAPEVAELAARAAALFGDQVRLLMAATGQWTRRVSLPGDPDRLADFIASQVQAPLPIKQELLETLSLPARLRREEELLSGRVRELTERWEERCRKHFAGAALN